MSSQLGSLGCVASLDMIRIVTETGDGKLSAEQSLT
jgi:hypothetical protein